MGGPDRATGVVRAGIDQPESRVLLPQRRCNVGARKVEGCFALIPPGDEPPISPLPNDRGDGTQHQRKTAVVGNDATVLDAVEEGSESRLDRPRYPMSPDSRP